MDTKTCLFGVVLILGCAQKVISDERHLTGSQNYSTESSFQHGDLYDKVGNVCLAQAGRSSNSSRDVLRKCFWQSIDKSDVEFRRGTKDKDKRDMDYKTCTAFVVLMLGCAQGVFNDGSLVTGTQNNTTAVTRDQHGDLHELVEKFCLVQARPSRHPNRQARRCYRTSKNKVKERCPESLKAPKCKEFTKYMRTTIRRAKRLKHIKTTKYTGVCETGSGNVKSYDKTRHICCAGGGLRKRQYKTDLCCNGSLYEGHTYACCNNTLYYNVAPPVTTVTPPVTTVTPPVTPARSASKECCENGQRVYCRDRRINEGYHHSWIKQTTDDVVTNMKLNDEKEEVETGGQAYTANEVCVIAVLAMTTIIFYTFLFLVVVIRRRKMATSRSSKGSEDLRPRSNVHRIERQPSEMEQDRYNNQTTDSHELPKPDPETELRSTTSKEIVHALVQTDDLKTINQTDSMGNNFTVYHTFDRHTKTLQLPNSSVRITVSDADIDEGPLECYASSFYDRSVIYKKLVSMLEEPFTIASPAVEYLFPKSHRLNDYAGIEMPHCAAKAKVIKVDSDPVFSNKANVQTVNKYKSIEDVPLGTECFYIELDAQKIIIYSKVFSWFVCLECRSHHQRELVGALYYTLGSVGKTKKCRVYLYILDNVFYRFEDYNHRLMNNISMEAKSTQKALALPRDIDGKKSLSSRLIMYEHTNFWGHKTDPDNPQTTLYPGCQKLSMEDILRCDRDLTRNGMPRCFEWFLETDTIAYPVPLEIVLKVEYSQAGCLPSNMPLHTTTYEISEEIYIGQKYEDPFPITTQAVQPLYDQLRGYNPIQDEHPHEALHPHPELPSSNI